MVAWCLANHIDVDRKSFRKHEVSLLEISLNRSIRRYSFRFRSGSGAAQPVSVEQVEHGLVPALPRALTSPDVQVAGDNHWFPPGEERCQVADRSMKRADGINTAAELLPDPIQTD